MPSCRIVQILLGYCLDFVRYFWIMRIRRQSGQELVVEDSGIALSVVLFLCSLPLFYVSTLPGKLGALFGACFFLLASLVFLRKTTFVFDAGESMVHWKGRKFLKVTRGDIPFKDVTGIGTETAFGSNNSTSYRLTVLTTQGPVPMAFMYGGNREKYESIREAILRFLHPEMPTAVTDRQGHSEPAIDEASIRSLLGQGRKVDAIELVRTSTKVGLTAAVRCVEEVENRMKAAR
jgi:hypothetical protein